MIQSLILSSFAVWLDNSNSTCEMQLIEVTQIKLSWKRIRDVISSFA